MLSSNTYLCQQQKEEISLTEGGYDLNQKLQYLLHSTSELLYSFLAQFQCTPLANLAQIYEPNYSLLDTVPLSYSLLHLFLLYTFAYISIFSNHVIHLCAPVVLRLMPLDGCVHGITGILKDQMKKAIFLPLTHFFFVSEHVSCTHLLLQQLLSMY